MTFGTITLVAVLSAVFSGLGTAAVAFIAPLFSHGVKLAEFRQAWINDQRKDIAEYVGIARRWVEKWESTNTVGGRTEEERLVLFGITNEALVILWRIRMRMNPSETNPQFEQDQELLRRLTGLLNPPGPAAGQAENAWRPLAEAAIDQAQLVLKTEWEVTKTNTLQTGLQRLRAWMQRRWEWVKRQVAALKSGANQ